MKQVKTWATLFVFASILVGFLLAFLLLPDGENSAAERRKLQQMPTLGVENLLSTDYMQELEKYAQDQFPLREQFRSAKALFRTRLLLQKDSNEIYLADGSAVKLEKELKEDEVRYAGEKISAITEQYLQGLNVYAAVIPDKHYFAAKDSGYPSLDYERLFALFQEHLQGPTYLDLRSALSLADYYRTDAHWRQEALGPLRDLLAQHMGIAAALPPLESYEEKTLFPFHGVYLGQSALPLEPDALRYLTSPAIEAARVRSAEKKGEVFAVYAPEKLGGLDGYDVFLHGAQAIMEIENPNATSGRELYLFRDSFGSSIAPLFVDAYAKITLIDLRYVAADYLAEFVEFREGQDVLFLYSTGIINSGRLLR